MPFNTKSNELRKKAEEKVNTFVPSAGSVSADIDAQRLLHELQVHQVELEMQNEELLQTGNSLEKMLKRYSDLFDFAPIGYLVLTREGTIQEANYSGVSLLGLERPHILGQHFGRYLTEESRYDFSDFLDTVFTSRSIKSCEVMLLNDAPPKIIHIEARPDEAAQECRLALLDITEQRRAEAELLKNEERFRMAVSATHAMVYDLDVAMSRMKSMDGLRELLGYESREAELSLEWWEKQIHPDDLDGCRAAFQRIQNEGGAHTMEYRLLHEDGRTIIVEDNATATRDADGKLVRIVGTVVDITKRKLGEEEVRQKHSILQTILESTTDYIYMKDLSGRYVVINSTAANAVAKPVTEIIGNNDCAIFPAETVHEINERERRLLADGRPQKFEETFLLGGKLRNLFTAKSVCRDSLGNVIGLVGVTRDVTEEKEFEKALRNSEEKYRTLFDVVPDALFIVDCNTFRFMDVNLAATKMYGYSKEEFLQLTAMDISSEKDLTEHALSSETLNVALRWHRKKNGETFPVEISGSYFLCNDQLTNIAAIRDISERRMVEESLQRSAAMLEAIGNSTPDSVFVKDSAGRFLYINPSGMKKLNLPEGHVIGKTISELLSNVDEITPLIAHDRKVMETKQTVVVEETFSTHLGTEFYLTSKSPLLNGDGKIVGLVGLSKDITKRKQLEDDLKCFNNRLQEMVESKTNQLLISVASLTKSERFKQSIIDSLPANIAVVNQNGVITSINKPWLQFGLNNGLSDMDSISKGINYLEVCRNACSHDGLISELANSALQGITSVLTGQESRFIMDYPCDSPDTKRWFKMTVMRPDSEFEGAVISHVDITVLKQLEEEQRSYTSHLISAIETERFRTARELHDDLGQRLTLFSFAIRQLKKSCFSSDFCLSALEDMQTDVDQMMGAIRHICTALRPTLLEELGLSAALKWLSKDFSRRSGVLCHATIEEGSCFDNDWDCRMTIFRIVQESLNNIIKHSSATKADISLKRIEGKIHVTINDNGRGITLKKRSNGKSLGLIGMRERALSVGATFEITGNKGRGTSVKLVIPCHCKEEPDAFSHS